MLLNLHNKTIHTFYVVPIYKASALYLQLLSWSDVFSVNGGHWGVCCAFYFKVWPTKNYKCFCNYALSFCGGLSCITKIRGCILLEIKWKTNILLISTCCNCHKKITSFFFFINQCCKRCECMWHWTWKNSDFTFWCTYHKFIEMKMNVNLSLYIQMI